MSMQLNPSEISELIKERIKDFDASTEARTEGTVVSLTDGISRIHGLLMPCRARCWNFLATLSAWR